MSTELMERNGQHEAPPLENAPMRSSFAESQARGEVDVQIATAKRFPRSVKKFQSTAMSLATLDEETASSCFYTLPRDGKQIEGPSVRLAEIVAASWGNMRAQANIVDENDEFITARGVCWDLENNVAVSTEVRRRICGKNGRKFSTDMINTTANAACSIALRNAVFKVVPMAIARPIYEAARKVAIGDATTLVKRRGDMVAYFAKMHVSAEQVCAAVGKAGIEDVGLEELATLKGLATAIKDGDTSVDDAFPVAQKEKPGTDKPATKTDALADKLAADQAGKAAPREPGDDLSPFESDCQQRFNACTNQDECLSLKQQYIDGKATDKELRYVAAMCSARIDTIKAEKAKKDS